jgi:hypothetical protein
LRAVEAKCRELSDVLEKLTLPALEVLSRRVGELEKTWAYAQSYLKGQGIVIPEAGRVEAPAPAVVKPKSKRSLLGRLMAGDDE